MLPRCWQPASKSARHHDSQSVFQESQIKALPPCHSGNDSLVRSHSFLRVSGAWRWKAILEPLAVHCRARYRLRCKQIFQIRSSIQMPPVLRQVSRQFQNNKRRVESESKPSTQPALETLRLRGVDDSRPTQDSAQAALEPPVDPLMPTSIAQSVSRPDDTQQFDLTPIKIPERGAAFSNFDSYKARMLYRLPARMFFSGTCENSLRLETNVFQTSRNPQADLVYRVLPNLTVGYALNRKTRLSSNFFFFRDQYASKDNILSRNIYSVGLRADRDFTINDKTTMTAGLFCRELFFNLSSSSPPLSDIIPSAVVVRRIGTHGAAYGSVMGQVRFQKNARSIPGIRPVLFCGLYPPQESMAVHDRLHISY